MRMLLKTKTNIITRDVIGREIKSVGSLHQSQELPLYSLNKLQDWNALFFFKLLWYSQQCTVQRITSLVTDIIQKKINAKKITQANWMK